MYAPHRAAAMKMPATMVMLAATVMAIVLPVMLIVM